MLIVSISWWFYHLGRRKVLVHGKLYAKLCYMSVAVFLFVVVFCKCQDYSQCLQLEWMKEWILPQPRDIIGIAVFVYENECQQAE